MFAPRRARTLLLKISMRLQVVRYGATLARYAYVVYARKGGCGGVRVARPPPVMHPLWQDHDTAVFVYFVNCVYSILHVISSEVKL